VVVTRPALGHEVPGFGQFEIVLVEIAGDPLQVVGDTVVVVVTETGQEEPGP
jgi:hypothetical protein